MTYCRHCGAEELTAVLCYKCLKHVRALCGRAFFILPLMGDEIAKDTAKAPTGGGGGGGEKTVISFPALAARDNLVLGIKALQSRARAPMTGKPKDLHESAHRLQDPIRDVAGDPLHYLVNDLERDLRACEQMVDTRQERKVCGRCTCGTLLMGYVGASMVKCRVCKAPNSVPEAQARLYEEFLDRLSGRWLPVPLMVVAFAGIGYDLKDNTVRQWIKRRKLVYNASKEVYFDEVLDLVETNLIATRP